MSIIPINLTIDLTDDSVVNILDNPISKYSLKIVSAESPNPIVINMNAIDPSTTVTVPYPWSSVYFVDSSNPDSNLFPVVHKEFFYRTEYVTSSGAVINEPRTQLVAGEMPENSTGNYTCPGGFSFENCLFYNPMSGYEVPSMTLKLRIDEYPTGRQSFFVVTQMSQRPVSSFLAIFQENNNILVCIVILILIGILIYIFWSQNRKK